MLLERQGELDHVSAALRRAHEGRGSQLVISGPLGIGKSALLRCLSELDGSGDTRVLRASASGLEQGFAFGVVRQLFDPVLSSAVPEVRERWLAGAAGLARIVFAADAPPSPEPPTVMMSEAAMQGLISLIRAISADKPMLVLVDDLQWVDEPSLRWLTRLAKLLDTFRVLVVATLREGDRHAYSPLIAELNTSAAGHLRPAPLSLQATDELIRHHMGQVPDEEFTHACRETTGGNPVFLMAVVVNVAQAGARPTAANIDMVRSLRPAQLRERLIHSLRAQSESVLAFAKAAVVLGEQADVELIGRLAGLDAFGCSAAMRAMNQLGILRGGQTPRFVHPVVQDAVEGAMSTEERQSLHVRAVKLLYGSGHSAEQVAAQLMAISTEHNWWAIEVLRAAADTAMRRGAPEVAVRYLRRALLDAAPDGRDRAHLLVDLAMAERGFDLSASVRHISYAVPLLRSVQERAAAVVRIAPTVLVAAPPPVRDLIAKVAEELGPATALTGIDRELAIRLEARVRYFGNTDPAELRDSVRRLSELGLDEMVGTSAERERLIVLLDAAMLSVEVPAHGVAVLGKRILDHEPATSTHVHTALPLLVTSLAAADAVGPLIPWLDLALERARMQDVTIEQALIRTEQSFALLHLGRVDEARTAAVDALDLAALDWRGSNSTATVALAAVAVELSDGHLISRLLELVDERTERSGISVMHRMLQGSAAALIGDNARALEYFVESGSMLDRVGWRNPVAFPWRLSAALLNGRLGNVDQALELAEDARSRAVVWGAPSGIGRALRVLGILTPGRRGVELLREAVAVLDRSSNAFELAKSLLELGSRLRAEDDPSAHDYLHRAHEVALQTGAEQLVAKSGMELEGPTRELNVTPGALTKAELRVVELAVEGHTNQAIADTLNVSRRAVEKHLTNSYRKLGIRRRSELAKSWHDLTVR